MAIQFSTARRAPARAEVVAHGLTAEAFSGDQPLPSGLDRDALVSLGFTGQAGQVHLRWNGLLSSYIKFSMVISAKELLENKQINIQ